MLSIKEAERMTDPYKISAYSVSANIGGSVGRTLGEVQSEKSAVKEKMETTRKMFFRP